MDDGAAVDDRAAVRRPTAADEPAVAVVRRRRWQRPAVVAPVAAVTLLAGAYVAAALSLDGRAPRGTEVLGAAVGGLGTEQVAAALAAPAADTADRPVPLRVEVPGQAPVETELLPAGLAVDVDATAADVTGAWHPRDLWRHVTGGGPTPPAVDVDLAELRPALAEQVAAQVDVAPQEGAVTFAAGAEGTAEPVVSDPVEGVALDVEAAADAVAAAWPTSGQEVLGLRAAVAPTSLDAAALAAAADELARPAVAGGLVVVVGGRQVELAASDVAPSLAVRPVDGRARLVADGAALQALLVNLDPELEQGAQDARFDVVDGAPVVVPGVPGAALDPQALAEAVVGALSPGPDGAEPTRRAEAEVVASAPATTTDELAGLGVVEQISTFATTLTADADRTQNIRLAAAAVDGTLLRPGEEFSLNDTVGERTPERGYRQAGVISGGRLVDGYGGGVSQLSTTLFNAMFFAGLDELEHKPHSFYISRYPEGREATIDWRSIDNRFRNDSPHGVYVAAGIEGNQVVVSMYGTRRYDVEAVKGPRTAVTQPRTIYDTDAGCSPQSSNPGFTTTVTRVMTPIGGGEEVSETFTTRYNAQNRVVCGSDPATAPSATATPGPAAEVEG